MATESNDSSQMEITLDEGSSIAATPQMQSVVSTQPNISGLNVALHPLVILNISDHYIRMKIRNQDANPPVIGALLGTQHGRDVDIINSFELPVKPKESGEMEVDHEFFLIRQTQFATVFPTHDFLGWYSIGSHPTMQDVAFHKQLTIYNESPLFLQISPHLLTTGNAKDLPIAVYETTIELIGNQPQTLFVKTEYKIETIEAERISVDAVARGSIGGSSTDKGDEAGGLVSHLTTQRNAIKMLSERVKLLQQYISDTKDGKIHPDHDILRQISSLSRRLPAIEGEEFREEFLREYNDVLLTSYLATITKGVNSVNELVDKFYLASGGSGKGSRNRPMGPMFM